MKNSQDIIGLPVFSVSDGKEIGTIKEMVINPEEGVVQFLLVEGEYWYIGAKVLPFEAVLGIGQHAVTTENEGQLTNLNESTAASNLVQRGIMIKGTKMLSRDGSFVGVVKEYEIEEKSGKVTALEFDNGEDPKSGSVDINQILTFGKDVIIVDRGKDNSFAPSKETSASEPAADASSDSSGTAKNDATWLFVERQKRFLLGKIVIKDIRDEQGKLIVSEGTIVDDTVLELTEKAGKMIELSENTK
ncbi:MAG: PRC-barrel domain-containing protein [Acidobacteriota bacterium]